MGGYRRRSRCGDAPLPNAEPGSLRSAGWSAACTCGLASTRSCCIDEAEDFCTNAELCVARKGEGSRASGSALRRRGPNLMSKGPRARCCAH